MVAQNQMLTNMLYADRHAYSNQLYNSQGRFNEMAQHLPDAVYQQPYYAPRVSNYHGGTTLRNMEGCGARDGPMGHTFAHLSLGNDSRRSRFEAVPFDRTYGYGLSAGGEGADDESDTDCSASAETEIENIVLRSREVGKGLSAGSASTAQPSKYMKSTGGHFEGASLGAGLSAGAKKAKRAPSVWILHVKKWAVDHKMSYRDALRDPQMKEAYHKEKKGGFLPLLPMVASALAPVAVKGVIAGVTSLIKKIMGKGASAGGVSGGSVLGGPSNDPVNKGRITGMGKKKGGRAVKTGSALFQEKGEFPLNVKSAVPPTPEAIASAGDVAVPLPTEAENALGGHCCPEKKKRAPRRTRKIKVAKPKAKK